MWKKTRQGEGFLSIDKKTLLTMAAFTAMVVAMRRLFIRAEANARNRLARLQYCIPLQALSTQGWFCFELRLLPQILLGVSVITRLVCQTTVALLLWGIVTLAQ